MMRRILTLTCLLAVALTTWAGQHKDNGAVVAAYVTGWNADMPIPDCSVLTHINYAFGNVNKTYDGVTIQHPERLRQLVELKKDHQIYIVLSIGGWTAGGFSEMASTERRRKAFATRTTTWTASTSTGNIPAATRRVSRHRLPTLTISRC